MKIQFKTIDQDFGKGTRDPGPFDGATRTQAIIVNGEVVGELVYEWSELGAYDGSVRITDLTAYIDNEFHTVHLIGKRSGRLRTLAEAKRDIKAWIAAQLS